ncbi:MAG TPA: SET domain-containing protein [Terriglobia bacterium]|nr:SET domain-containing protein [Terriglobia bacterium]
MNKETLLKQWQEVKCRLMRGRHGVGVFAVTPIARGEEPLPGDRTGRRWVRLNRSDYEDNVAIAPSVAEMMKDYHVEEDDGMWVRITERGMIDPAWFVNGGTTAEANVEWVEHRGGSLMIAVRDIEAGEELLLDYKDIGKLL